MIDRNEIKQFLKDEDSEGGGVCSFAMIAGKVGDKLTYRGNDICHAKLSMYQDLKEVYTSLWVRSEGMEKAKAWWEWIFSSSSPFAEVACDSCVLYNELGTPYGAHIWNLKGKDRRVLAALCIASRMPWEYPGRLNSWWWFLHQGLDTDKAFILSVYLELEGTFWSYMSYEDGHSHVNAASVISFASLKARKPRGKPKPIGDNYVTSYNGCGSIYTFENRNIEFLQRMWRHVCVGNDTGQIRKVQENPYDGIFPYLWEFDQEQDDEHEARWGRTALAGSPVIHRIDWSHFDDK